MCVFRYLKFMFFHQNKKVMSDIHAKNRFMSFRIIIEEYSGVCVGGEEAPQ
jgi:hypothetical protein